MDVGGGTLWSFLALRQIFDATEPLLHTLQQHRGGWESNSAKHFYAMIRRKIGDF